MDSSESSIIVEKKATTPLPWSQLFIVYLIQFSEPVAATVVYPFIAQFIRETGITEGDERRTGYFSGTIESAFFLAEAVTVIGWGMASDRFGRRPLLLIGPVGLAFALLGFGMSTTFWWLVVFRCLQGMFNGNIGIAKAVIGELTDSTNIADAFSVLPFMWGTGETIGPTIGGLLSRPADHWPHTLGKVQYLRSHPYFLPCLVAATVAFQSFICGLFALEETSPIIKREMRQGNTRSVTSQTATLDIIGSASGLHSGEISQRRLSVEYTSNLAKLSGALHPPPLGDLLSVDAVVVLLNCCIFTFCSTAATVLIPLVWSTSTAYGGLGFTPYRIGVIVGSFGAINAFVQLRFLGKIVKWFGPQTVFIAGSVGLLLHFGCFVLARFFARNTGADWRIWCIIVVQLGAEAMSYASYGSMQILVQGVSPSKAALGAMNGVAQAVMSVARSLAPLFASSIFAISLQRNLAGGNAIYYIMLLIVACYLPLTLLLPRKLRLD